MKNGGHGSFRYTVNASPVALIVHAIFVAMIPGRIWTDERQHRGMHAGVEAKAHDRLVFNQFGGIEWVRESDHD